MIFCKKTVAFFGKSLYNENEENPETTKGDLQMQDFLKKMEDFFIQMWVYLYRFMSHMIGQDPDDAMIEEMFGKVL